MKSLILFLHEVLVETGTWCHTSTSMDEKYVHARIEHEGLSFLTITLPGFGKDFEKSLDQGFVDRNLFTGFQRKGELPRFLGGFLDLVFDRASGRLVDEVSIDAIRALRQITLMFGKIAVECSEERTKAAFDKYIDCEKDVKKYDTLWSAPQVDAFKRVGTLLWYDIFSRVQKDIEDEMIMPKHGPGSTADGLQGNLKFNQRTWTDRLEAVFPMGRFAFHSFSSYFSELDNLTFLEPGAEIPVSVIAVPKTLQSPRLIAKEPTHMQYMQQAILGSLASRVNADNLASHVIGFDDQVPNQELARYGSLSGSLATLDLSEASDRVSNQHVRVLLESHPLLAESVDACRSRKADVGGHGIIRLAKFASMGSALCFPFEAMVFTTVIFMGIEKVLRRPIRRSDVSRLVGQVRVYGDDIIVPVEFVSAVMNSLESFGFKVNTRKSFWTGKFRESCGKEYYDGKDVSIVRVRQFFPTSRQHVPELVSTVSLRNQLSKAGYASTVDWLDRRIERLIPFPAVAPTSRALGRHTPDGFETQRMCPNLQRPMVKATWTKSTLPASKLDGVGALMKGFLKAGKMPFADEKHLERAGRAVSVDIKHGWTYAY